MKTKFPTHNGSTVYFRDRRRVRRKGVAVKMGLFPGDAVKFLIRYDDPKTGKPIEAWVAEKELC